MNAYYDKDSFNFSLSPYLPFFIILFVSPSDSNVSCIGRFLRNECPLNHIISQEIEQN